MRKFRMIGMLALALLAGGCAGPEATKDADATTVSDPLEDMNRFFFDLNQRLDRNAGKPVATAYKQDVPQRVRGSLHNVLDNLGGPVNVANDLLEVQFTNAGVAAGRFLVNTTIGVAGIFDVATGWGLPERNRDFGETMGTYGVPPGPYLVLPLRGSTDVRDFAGNYLDGFVTPLHFVRYDGSNYVGLMKSTLGSMDNRSANIITYEDIERSSVDYYAAMRTLYLERRARLVEDRTVRTAELPDF
ncbi:MAG TPA: VacJ family lipoprotein [Rhizomicrobium sp.]|jgi:phospholipid-binding lipoprotein MlaA|nr:VacJ family lipoprotein [Rhizomicrobium sp.]